MPARDHAPGSLRAIYGEGSEYPRYIRDDRGPTWTAANLEKSPAGLSDLWVADKCPIIGYIPEAPHTYAILEGLYGFMNEHQVSMGESTCAVRLLDYLCHDGTLSPPFHSRVLATIHL